MHLGARVLVTSGSDAKLARAREMGAAGGANYRTWDWAREIAAQWQGGPDVVIDSVGGETFTESVELLKAGGRIVSYGATTGPVKDFVLRNLFWKQATAFGTTMGSPREFAAMPKLLRSRAAAGGRQGLSSRRHRGRPSPHGRGEVSSARSSSG